jgi:hypothetical protein
VKPIVWLAASFYRAGLDDTELRAVQDAFRFT